MAAQHSSGDILADRRYRYAEACLADGDWSGAADLAEQALEIAPRYAPAWILLGRAREAMFGARGDPGQRAGAVRAYACARDIDPDGAFGAQVDLARLGAGDGLPALTPAYVRALFDGYAPRFERHLVEGLGYVGPALLRAALDRFADAPRCFPVAVDLGCGTGLAGAAMAERVGHLTGIDLSPAMLALARAKGCYDRLVEADGLAFLAAGRLGSVDLCVAADVFIYIADLGPMLAAMARALRPAGIAAFTVQSHAGSGAVLSADGRYAHADGHLTAAIAAAGLKILGLQPAAVRREGGEPVPGRVAVLRAG